MKTDMPVSDADVMRACETNVDAHVTHLKYAGIGHEVVMTMPVRWRFLYAVLASLVTRRRLRLRVLLPDDDA